MGVRDFCVGWDIATVFGWCKQQAALMEQLGLKQAADTGDISYASAKK